MDIGNFSELDGNFHYWRLENNIDITIIIFQKHMIDIDKILQARIADLDATIVFMRRLHRRRKRKPTLVSECTDGVSPIPM